MAVRLVDTNVISFVLKGHTLAAAYQPHLTGYTLAVSFMTVAEMREGAALAGWGKRRLSNLETTLNQLLILHSDDAVCQKMGGRSCRSPSPTGRRCRCMDCCDGAGPRLGTGHPRCGGLQRDCRLDCH